MLLGKTKLNTIKNLISKALIDSCINHDKYFSVNNVLTLFTLLLITFYLLVLFS